MSQYICKFVVVNTIPTSTTSADSLSIQMTAEYGNEGFELTSVIPIPNTNPPGMLLVFQKMMP